jgi:glucokinase
MFNHAAAIGVDIGHNSLNLAVVKMKGEIIAAQTIPLIQPKSKDYLISVLVSAIRDIRIKVASEGINPICIGISAKGFIDHVSGIILGPDQGIRDWTNVPLAKIVNSETGLPVYVGNDANLMTIAEHRFGAGRGYNNVIFVALRTGIGGGIIINGKLYRGVNNAGGEVGQMIINFDNGISDLGIRGSYEYFASASAVVRRYNEENAGRNTESEKTLTCREIFEMSYAGSPVATKIITENARMVGIGLGSLISIFAPEIIIVGGGMSEANESYFSMIKQSAIENSLENCRSEVLIVRAQLGSKAALLGSGYYSLTRLAGKSI